MRWNSVNKWKNCTVYVLYDQFLLGFGFSKGSQSGVNVRELIWAAILWSQDTDPMPSGLENCSW